MKPKEGSKLSPWTIVSWVCPRWVHISQMTTLNQNHRSKLQSKLQVATTQVLVAKISVVLITNRKIYPGKMIFLRLMSNKGVQKLVCLQQTIRERRMFFKT